MTSLAECINHFSSVDHAYNVVASTEGPTPNWGPPMNGPGGPGSRGRMRGRGRGMPPAPGRGMPPGRGGGGRGGRGARGNRGSSRAGTGLYGDDGSDPSEWFSPVTNFF